jgi:hypothetical protein
MSNPQMHGSLEPPRAADIDGNTRGRDFQRRTGCQLTEVTKNPENNVRTPPPKALRSGKTTSSYPFGILRKNQFSQIAAIHSDRSGLKIPRAMEIATERPNPAWMRQSHAACQAGIGLNGITRRFSDMDSSNESPEVSQSKIPSSNVKS